MEAALSLADAARSADWPADWAQRLAGVNCRHCEQLGRGDNERAVFVHSGAFTEVYLDRYPQAPGHVLVVWRRGHIAEPFEAEPDGVDGYWREVVLAVKAVQQVYQPLKLNVMTLGNDVPHLNTRIVTRYWKDPAPGGPLPWDLVHSAVPVADQELRRQAQVLRQALVELSF